MRAMGILALTGLVAGCTTGSIRDGQGQDSEAILAELRGAVERASGVVEEAEPVAEPVKVRIPRWLAEQAEYQCTDEEDARDAIIDLARPRPVRFEMFGDRVDVNEYRPLCGDYSKWEHLRAISAQLDWEIDTEASDVVVVTDRVTRQYPIAALPGNRQTQMEFRSLGAGGVGSGQDQATPDIATAATGNINRLSFDATPVDELGEALFVALRGYGVNAGWQISPSATSVTVNGSIAAHRRAEGVIEDFNRRANTRARITISVYEVEFVDGSQVSLDLTLMRDAAVSSFVGLDGDNLVSVTDQGLALRFDFAGRTSRFDVASFVGNLLRLQGRTTQRLHEAVEVTTTDMVSIENTRTLPYVSEVSTGNQVGGAFSTLSPQIQIEQVSEGLGVHVLASMSEGHDVLNVQLALSQNELVRWDEYAFGSGAGAISGRLPIMDSQHRMLRLTLEDGETRLVANLTRDANSDERAQGLGVMSRRENVRKQTVIVVSANVL